MSVLSREDWPLRPELVESSYHLYVATRDPHYLHVAEEIICPSSLHEPAKTLSSSRTNRTTDRTDLNRT